MNHEFINYVKHKYKFINNRTSHSPPKKHPPTPRADCCPGTTGRSRPWDPPLLPQFEQPGLVHRDWHIGLSIHQSLKGSRVPRGGERLFCQKWASETLVKNTCPLVHFTWRCSKLRYASKWHKVQCSQNLETPFWRPCSEEKPGSYTLWETNLEAENQFIFDLLANTWYCLDPRLSYQRDKTKVFKKHLLTRWLAVLCRVTYWRIGVHWQELPVQTAQL